MINVLGINISNLKKKQILEKIENFLNRGSQAYAVTPNPEFILEAQADEEFFYILNKADLAIPDGIGLKFAAWVLGKNIYRYTGADLVKTILEKARSKKLEVRIGVVNWVSGLSKKQEIKKIIDSYNNKNLVVDIDRDAKMPQEMVDFKPNILFCTLGAPWQEKFIYHNIEKILSVKLAIGVGGAFDFLTSKLKRAPKFIQMIGLEWVWRLILQPWRIKRMYKAAVIFPWEYIKWRFIHPFLYRKNVSCFLYKKENKIIKVLIVERENEKNHWQLPQGGTDGESLIKAGGRELSEEINSKKFKSIAVFKNIHKYKFDYINKKAMHRGGIYQKNLGYKGQKQSLFIAEFTGVDDNIKINFWDHSSWKWVDADNLVNSVFPTRQTATKKFYNKFKSLQITN